MVTRHNAGRHSLRRRGRSEQREETMPRRALPHPAV